MSFFSERLQILRKKMNWSQTQLADCLNLSQRQISKYEKNQDIPNINLLIKTTEIFGVTPDYLLGISPDNDVKKSWVQNSISKRLNLLSQPDGKFEFPYFHQGKEKKSIFRYSFGLLPLQHVDFMPTFLVIHEISDGTTLEMITGYSRLKEPDQMSDSHYHRIRGNFCSDDNLPFLAFINHLNSTLNLGYRLDKESNGMHRVQLITTLPSAVPSVPYYAEVASGSGKPVSLKEIIYAEFLNKQYLPLSNEEKAKFLEPYRDEAFKW